MAVTQKEVNDALLNATSNDYSFVGWSVSDIVLDLLAYWWKAEEEGETEDTLTPLVADWRTRNPEA